MTVLKCTVNTWHMHGCTEDGERNLQHQGCVGHLGSLTSSGVPRLSQQQCEAMRRGSIGSFLLPGIQMSHLIRRSNKEKHPNARLEGAWAPSETQQSSVGARHGVILPLPSTGSANIILAWQQPLPLLTQKLPVAVLCSYPCFTLWPASNRGRVLKMLSAWAAGSHSLAFHRKQHQSGITFRLSQNQRATVSYKSPEWNFQRWKTHLFLRKRQQSDLATY